MRATGFHRQRVVGLPSFLAAAVFLLLPSLAFAQAGRVPIRAAEPGPIVEAPDGVSEMEIVRFDTGATATLLALAFEESAVMDGWPVAPGVRATAMLRRFDVYAPDAKIVEIKDGVTTEIPRSRLAFFTGKVVDGTEAGSSIVAWVDPDTGDWGGLGFTNRGTMVLEAPRPGETGGRLAEGRAFHAPGVRPTWTCGRDDESPEAPLRGVETPPSAPVGFEPLLGAAPMAVDALTKTAIVAFDTDAEYLNLRFSNNTANASSYIASLVASTTAIYERDAGSGSGNGVRILQGYTILRVGEAADPYADTTGGADLTKLNEFTDYWETNYPRTVVRRAVAALLSGRQGGSCTPFGCSASGIAWVPGLCAGTGYSVNQLFNIPDFGITFDVLIVAHEIGHNFGAFHTHNCAYGTPPIDTCLAAEGGCSPKGSCPAPQTINGVSGVTGTLMSYCHLRNPDDCDSFLVFHPRSIADTPSGGTSVLSRIGSASCLATLSGGVVPASPTISSLSVTSGPLGGGTSTVITGTNFVSGATVAFVELPSNDVFGASVNSKAAASVTFNSSTTLTVTTPSATNAGAVDVVAMNPDFQTATKPSGFTYSAGPPPPSVTSIFPNFGPTAGGTPVTITGSNFVSGATVAIGGINAPVGTFSTTSITATTGGPHAAGTVNVVVTNPDTQTGTLTNGFYYAPPAVATKFFPVTPCRIIDTRNADSALGGPVLAAGASRSFTVLTMPTTCGVPSTARTITVNVAITAPTQEGELRIFPGNGVVPATSAISFKAGQTRSNNAHVLLATDGTGSFQVQNNSAGTVHFIVDVNGYYQ